MIRPLSLASLLALGLPALAQASSSDAWEEFRVNVQAACEALAPKGGALQVEVDPYGSESYGLAILTHRTETGQDRYVCVYDKRSQKAEISGAFPAGR